MLRSCIEGLGFGPGRRPLDDGLTPGRSTPYVSLRCPVSRASLSGATDRERSCDPYEDTALLDPDLLWRVGEIH